MARATWSDMKTEAIKELRSRSDIATRVERWLREAYEEIAYGYRFYELEKSATFTLGATKSEITFASMLVTDIKHIFSLRDTTNKRKLVKSSFRRLDRMDTSIAGVPVEYCRFGSSILFNSAPSTNTAYKLRYRKQITEPVFGAVSPETPSEWDEVIRLKGVARGFEALFEPDMVAEKTNIANLIIASLPTDENVETEDDNFGIAPRME